jgi:hypothetical protein
MNADISVVILSWNDREHLQECILSLRECANSRQIEILVVDNASTDGSAELVQTKFPEVKLLRNSENLGFAKANNLGIKASQGKYVCLLNSDIKVLKGCLDALADYLDRHRDIGIIGPKVLNGDRTHQSSCRRFPGLWNNFCSATGLAVAFRETKLLSGEHMFYFKGNRIQEVDVLVGCFWMTRRAAIAEFGLLDEDFFMYAEDVDWCRRCWEAGWRVVFFPAAQAIHYRGGSSANQDPIWVAVTQQHSILRYWRKHHGLAGWLSIACLMFAHKMARLCAAALNGLLQPSQQQESKARIRVMGACLRALLSRSDAAMHRRSA